MFKKGFTLIELLIVIAILGILAIGLMAAIDPLEQLKKGHDTATRNAVEEFYNSGMRYYAVKSKFPWGSTAVNTSTLMSMTNTYLQSIVSVGELKTRFIDMAKENRLDRIYVTSTHADPATQNRDELTVCFLPESKAFKSEDSTYFSASGGTAVGCPNVTLTTCYWCLK